MDRHTNNKLLIQGYRRSPLRFCMHAKRNLLTCHSLDLPTLYRGREKNVQYESYMTSCAENKYDIVDWLNYFHGAFVQVAIELECIMGQ